MSSDYTARLWDIQSGKELAKLEGHTNTVRGLAFSPDGSRLATASNDYTAIIWPMPHLALKLACARAHHYLAYARVAEICEPLIGQTVDAERYRAPVALADRLPERYRQVRFQIDVTQHAGQVHGSTRTVP